MTQTQPDRRLMAIPFTDVAGYTALIRTLASQFEGELVEILRGASHMGGTVEDPRLIAMVIDFVSEPDPGP